MQYKSLLSLLEFSLASNIQQGRSIQCFVYTHWEWIHTCGTYSNYSDFPNLCSLQNLVQLKCTELLIVTCRVQLCWVVIDVPCSWIYHSAHVHQQRHQLLGAGSKWSLWFLSTSQSRANARCRNLLNSSTFWQRQLVLLLMLHFDYWRNSSDNIRWSSHWSAQVLYYSCSIQINAVM